jgi:hypothetical protein
MKGKDLVSNFVRLCAVEIKFLHGCSEHDRGCDRAVHFCEPFDPENPLETDWSGFKYPVPMHFVPRFREAHAVATIFHLNDELAAKFPVLNCQIYEGWPAHYQRPVHINDILQPPSTSENSFEEKEIEWLQKTARYYVPQMSEEQREEKSVTAAQARRILGGKVMCKLPCRPMASTADGRDSAAVIAGLASAS